MKQVEEEELFTTLQKALTEEAKALESLLFIQQEVEQEIARISHSIRVSSDTKVTETQIKEQVLMDEQAGIHRKKEITAQLTYEVARTQTKLAWKMLDIYQQHQLITTKNTTPR